MMFAKLIISLKSANYSCENLSDYEKYVLCLAFYWCEFTQQNDAHENVHSRNNDAEIMRFSRWKTTFFTPKRYMRNANVCFFGRKHII